MKQIISIIIVFLGLTASASASYVNPSTQVVGYFDDPHQLICNATSLIAYPAGCGADYTPTFDWHDAYRPALYAQLQAPITLPYQYATFRNVTLRTVRHSHRNHGGRW